MDANDANGRSKNLIDAPVRVIRVIRGQDPQYPGTLMILRIFVVWFRLVPFLLGFLRDRRRWILAGPPRFLSDEAHRERARKLTERIASLGPSFIKLAQPLGIRADIVPPIYLEELA